MTVHRVSIYPCPRSTEAIAFTLGSSTLDLRAVTAVALRVLDERGRPTVSALPCVLGAATETTLEVAHVCGASSGFEQPATIVLLPEATVPDTVDPYRGEPIKVSVVVPH